MPASPRPLLLLILLLAACDGPAHDPANDSAIDSAIDSTPAIGAAACSPNARFTAKAWGDLRLDLDWHGPALDCNGMPRPRGEGARLRFAGQADTGSEMLELAFIVALPELEPGVTASELAARVTLMQENDGRFYSTRDNDICWADVTRQARVDDGTRYDIAGIVYCVAPLPATRGDGSVVLRDVAFAGRLDWRAPE